MVLCCGYYNNNNVYHTLCHYYYYYYYPTTTITTTTTLCFMCYDNIGQLSGILYVHTYVLFKISSVWSYVFVICTDFVSGLSHYV